MTQTLQQEALLLNNQAGELVIQKKYKQAIKLFEKLEYINESN